MTDEKAGHSYSENPAPQLPPQARLHVKLGANLTCNLALLLIDANLGLIYNIIASINCVWNSTQ
jgi:hypothetical protein